MVQILAVSLGIWIGVGLLNLASCINHRKCLWSNYWLAYSVLIISLISQIAEQLA